MKKISIFFKLVVVLLCFQLIIMCNIFSYAIENGDIIEPLVDVDATTTNTILKPVVSSPIVDINTPIRVSFDNTDVLSYSIETEGLIATEVTDDSMEYDITTTEEYGVLDVYATYADDIVVKSSIYTYCNKNTVYVSEYSKKNALERYLANAVENNIYTLEEAENIWTGFDFQNEDIEGNIIDPDIETNGFLFSDKGTICGTLEWKDD